MPADTDVRRYLGMFQGLIIFEGLLPTTYLGWKYIFPHMDVKPATITM